MAGRKLKVFQAQFGFYDTVVAAASQSAALRAWGVHQNLFASGEAMLATDEAAITAAQAQPETPLRRPVGSMAPFELEPSALPTLPPGRKSVAKAPAKSKTRRGGEPEPDPPDRKPLDAAEAALAKLDAARKQEEAELQERQDDLDRARGDAQGRYVERRKSASVAVVAARKVYRAAGGED